ncbi:hypothetical protein, partial [Halomonas sp. ND22Bw]|uniref:hypothetical protein n=1 Tax=Halomonas sp. ND22Bw TaxID=2054178 RepID=UPI001C6365E4
LLGDIWEGKIGYGVSRISSEFEKLLNLHLQRGSAETLPMEPADNLLLQLGARLRWSDEHADGGFASNRGLWSLTGWWFKLQVGACL